MTNRNRHRAFTLIELLVVISIIALLIGILLPVLSNARESSQRMKCSSNQRALSQGMFTFQADFGTMVPAGSGLNLGNRRPTGVNWYDVLLGTGGEDGSGSSTGYLGTNVRIEVQRCPLVVRDFPDYNEQIGRAGDGEDSIYTYKYSATIGGVRDGVDAIKPASTDDIPKTSRTVMITETFVPRTYALPEASDTFSPVSGLARNGFALFRNIGADEIGIAHIDSLVNNSSFVMDSIFTLNGREGNSNQAFADGSVSAEPGTQTSRNMNNSVDNRFDNYEELIWKPF